MGWIKTTTRAKPHRCRRPRIKRRHGHGSTWQCDTCSTIWEIHRGSCCTHWNRDRDFCDHCGPGEPIESPDQATPVEPGNVTGQ